MWQHRTSSMGGLNEDTVKMLKENEPYKRHKLSDQFTLYELDHPFISDGKPVDFKCDGDFLTVIVVQESLRPYACQYHQFIYKNVPFEVCESINYTVFRLE